MLIFSANRTTTYDNILYFYIVADPNPDPSVGVEKILLLSDDYTVASYNGEYFRVCEVDMDADGYIKVWEVDPFAGYEGYKPLPDRDDHERT